MKFGSWVFLSLLVFCGTSDLAAEEFPPMPEGPLLLTGTSPEQLRPEYWINRIPQAEQLLKTPDEIIDFNREIRQMLSSQADIFQMETKRRGADIRDQLELEYGTVKSRILFGADNQRIPQSLFENDIRPVMAWDKVPSSIRLRWGAAAQATSVRALPTDVKMLEEIGDIEFDQLQYTLIKLWTPVAVYHESSDGEWFYIQAPYVRGWVKSKDIALFETRSVLKKYAGGNDSLAVTGESIFLYADPELQRKFQKPSMGTVIPLAGRTETAFIVWVPAGGNRGGMRLKKFYVDVKSDVSQGFLPYTQANVIRQAFKLLGARYGWGGMYDGRDCSGFTQDVFLPFGVAMPRNSKDQIFVGTQINHFRPMRESEAKMAAIRSGTPGVTLMTMPLHQMLYLGEVGGRFFAIHSTWAERISKTSDEKRRINQVVVSDLSLNGQSYLGSLFDRIISVNEVV